MLIPRRSRGVLTTLLVVTALASHTALAAPQDQRTTTRLAVSDRQAVLGQPVTFTATVSTPTGVIPTGSVTFTVDGVVLGTVTLNANGAATLVSSTLALGHHKVIATFAPQGPFNTSHDHVVMHVRLIPTETVLAATPSPSVFGEPVTFTATVTSPAGVPTGTVTFTVDGGVAGTVTLAANGQATLVLSGVLGVGDHVVTANFIGSGPFRPSEATLLHAVTMIASSTTVTATPSPSVAGDSVTFAAQVSAAGGTPTGTVTFIVDGTTQGTAQLDANGQATMITNVLAPGTHTVVAQFTSDDPGVLSSQSSPLTHLVRSGSIIVAGTDARVAHVKVFDAATQTLLFSFLPYGGFTGGVRVAAGDVNGDGIDDVITASVGVPAAHVKVFDGRTIAEIRSFLAFVSGGEDVSVAGGDVNGDGFDDIITGAAANSHVKVFDGATLAELSSFLAYPGFNGGVNVAAGDVNNDGFADIITGAGASAPHVKAFDGATNVMLKSFLAYPGFAGGVYVAAGDVNGDGFADIITGAGSSLTHVKVFDGVSNGEQSSFLAYGGFTGGVRVGSVDADNDGDADIITAPAAPIPHVKVFDGSTLAELASFLAFEFAAGVFVNP